MQSDASAWARGEFGSIQAGDRRRKLRLVSMAARAAERPAAKISEVFRSDRERQGAYDLLEGGKLSAEAVQIAMGSATAARAAACPFAYVSIDGTSITLTDREQAKDFGHIGSKGLLRGLKVINALGLDPHGVPLGLFTQVWWARPAAPIRVGTRKERRAQKQKSKRKRGPSEKETQYWLRAIEQATALAKHTGAKLWFQLDREADSQAILLQLTDSNHQFTVRGSSDRVIDLADGRSGRLRDWLRRKPAQGAYEFDVPSGPKRAARRACVAVRWGQVVLRMRGKPKQLLEVNVVWAHEHNTCPRGENPVDWLLLTSAEVRSMDDAREVIRGYTLRWRIETFHKTWKSGACNIEASQLRSRKAVTVWASLLAAVAARVERLRLLSRTDPDQPASIELDRHEVRALILLKREQKKKNETVPDTMPTIGQAMRWIADLGGYTGRSSGGPPGSITIRRGLEYLKPAAELLRQLEAPK
jgi:hypothetical protein